MAGIDMSALLPFMMGGGKNLNPQDLMAMMMRSGGNGGASQNTPPPNTPPLGGNMQMQLLMQMMSMMNNSPKPAQPVGFRPIDGICPCTALLYAMLRRGKQ